ncbi:MAG: DUF2502 domain-containing protein [Candidatus Accumulibacter sp.]|uniref:DUF2502 domain-containing protein n=1 Tax=Accumulibacter sp. TaxID=2053492 RepID=UPI001A0ACE87|nr:DUF2502 domain-containing protein [Accumulibacter sp.]MBE2261044.1 DUF2502 domain-containing protein [Paracoccaceae bacterium]MCP5249254.1 DUF2502 domain-containing protein [Accumulibacter sp.]
MKKAVGCALLALLPLLAQAGDVQINVNNVRIQGGGVTVNVGDRDKRGYYWDGKVWRDPDYWHKYHGNGQGKNKGKGYHCPPGQAKKGNC